MQKTIKNSSGVVIGVYYPITGKLAYSNGKCEKMNNQEFVEFCNEMEYQTL